jgi:hypothetical protein
MRVTIASGSHWAELMMPDTVRLIRFEEVSFEGPGAEGGVERTGDGPFDVYVGHPLAESGDPATMTVEFRLIPTEDAGSLPDELPFLLATGCFGSATVDVYNVQGAEPVLVATGSSSEICGDPEYPGTVDALINVTTSDLISGS